VFGHPVVSALNEPLSWQVTLFPQKAELAPCPHFPTKVDLLFALACNPQWAPASHILIAQNAQLKS
jgi:hypothetical protein